MREYKYHGFDEPIIVDDNGHSTYKGKSIEPYIHGYTAVGMSSGFSISQLTKAHYIGEMKRIDAEIVADEYKKSHKKEFNENCAPAEESLEYFFSLVEGE